MNAGEIALDSVLQQKSLGLVGDALVVLGSIAIGCFAGCTLIAIMNARLEDKDEKGELDQRLADRRKIYEYQQKYCEELSRLEEKELTHDELNELGRCQVTEDTPFGEVIMSYNPRAESFWYYTDARNVPFKTLDAVARCFAVTNNCKQICVNYKEELAAMRNAFKDKLESADDPKDKSADDPKDKPADDPKDTLKKRSVFATFKKYDKNGPNKRSRTKNPIIYQKSNRFTYKGKLLDAPTLDSSSDEEKESRENVSFADYKRNL